MMKKDTFTLARVVTAVAIAAIVVTAISERATAGQGYWDLFSVNLTTNGLYWNQVNGGAGALGDPLVSPDPNGSPIFDTATSLGGIAYGFGGHDFGTGSLESTAMAGNSIQVTGASSYYVSITLDSASSPDVDAVYPSWGTFSNIAVQQYDGTNWTVYNPTWVVSPYSPVGGTTQGAGSVTVGAGEVGSAESGSQVSGIYGIGATLPFAQGYQVDFDTDLSTWDSYSLTGSGGGPGGGQGTPGKPANVVPPLQAVTGKEYSNMMDEDSIGFIDPMQNIAFDGTGLAWDTFDYSGSGPNENYVDAIANSLDAYYQEVITDQVPLMLSFGPCGQAGDIKYQMAQADITGTWATPGQINAASPPDDVDGLELWGPEEDDANMFSLVGDFGASVYRYDPGTHTSTSYIMKGALKNAIGTAENIDLDALMVWDIEGNNSFGAGDSIMFSIQETQSVGGAFDGGEIWVWNFGGAAQFLVHGGETWNTAHNVGAHFGVGTEEVNALEAVPEPVTLALLLIGGLLGLLRKRRA